jgi:hypothetical protein
MNWNLIGIPQHICDVVFEGFADIMSEHLLEVERDALHKEVSGLGRSFVMSDSIDLFPQTFSHLGLEIYSLGCLASLANIFL